MSIPIIIDTDPGIDDAVAIMLAAASPEVNLLGLTAVAGNVGLEHTAANMAALADLLGLECPLGKGADGPLWRRDLERATHVHGANGFGGYELAASSRELEPALPLMARLIEESADPVTVIAIGPLTNIAGLMTFYPETARRVKRFVLMGGGTGWHLGNATPAAEFNMYADPDAAARVFAFGAPLTLVGLQVTNTALVGMRHLPSLAATLASESADPSANESSDVARMVQHLMTTYRSTVEDGGTAQHDSVAVAAVIDPSLIETESLHVDVENTGRLTSGMTVIDHTGATGEAPNCDVAMALDVARFRALLNTRLGALNADLAPGRAS